MDNNSAEQAVRGPVTGRKNDYGSGSIWSANLAAMLFSIFQTLGLWHINHRRWLLNCPETCANHGGKAAADVAPFLPWKMGAAITGTRLTASFRIRHLIMRYCGRDFSKREQLPPARRAKAKVKPFISTAATDPQEAVTQPVHRLAPLKDIWLFPLCSEFKQILAR